MFQRLGQNEHIDVGEVNESCLNRSRGDVVPEGDGVPFVPGVQDNGTVTTREICYRSSSTLQSEPIQDLRCLTHTLNVVTPPRVVVDVVIHPSQFLWGIERAELLTHRCTPGSCAPTRGVRLLATPRTAAGRPRIQNQRCSRGRTRPIPPYRRLGVGVLLLRWEGSGAWWLPRSTSKRCPARGESLP